MMMSLFRMGYTYMQELEQENEHRDARRNGTTKKTSREGSKNVVEKAMKKDKYKESSARTIETNKTYKGTSGIIKR